MKLNKRQMELLRRMYYHSWCDGNFMERVEADMYNGLYTERDRNTYRQDIHKVKRYVDSEENAQV